MEKRKPNILFIVSHDLGRHLGCYGVPTVQTPNLDRLASEGIRFARGFCVAPQCSPSRAAIFTGRYPHSNGVMGLSHEGFDWDLHRGERHMAGLCHDAGYYSALAHVQHETTRPGEMGYDRILQESDFGLDRNGEAELRGGRLQGPARRPTALACEFFKTRRGQEQPFFLQVGYFEPHRVPGTPHEFGSMPPDAECGVWVPPYLVDDEGARHEFAGYQGAIQTLDAAMGTVLETLEENGLQDDTIVVFTTDHGIPFPRAKCSLYDPGLETCLIVRWPGGGWSGGQVRQEMVPHIDLLPTLLETCEVPIPDSVQGRSFAPLLNSRENALSEYQPRDHFFGEMTYHDYYDPIRCIRTETHKLLVYFCYNVAFMDPSQSWRPATMTRVPSEPAHTRHELVELYDLQADPLEQHNLARDASHAGLRVSLLGQLYQWMVDTNDPLLQGVPPSPMHQRALATLRDT